MIPISELKVVEDTIFRSKIEYYKPSIYRVLEGSFLEENEFSHATIVKLKNFIKGKKELAFNAILEKDIRTISRNIEATPKEFDEALWRDMLPRIRDEVKKTLGLDFKPRSIFFQDSFPEGLYHFEKKGASSVTIFEGHKDTGIYFLNKRVSSFFTPILMIHEQMHSCLSQNKPKEQMYIEWFEEALCQWYSLQIYYNITRNLDVIDLYRQRSYLYSRIKDEHNFTRRYYEYMKIMSRIFMHGGPQLLGKILIDYLGNRRDRVNSYLGKRLAVKYIPKSEIEDFLAGFPVEIEPERLQPLEYLVLKEALKPKKIDEISGKVKAPGEFVVRAILGLQAKGMIVIKDESIEINWRKKDLVDKGLIKPYIPI
jgi:hypothetical protein